LYIRYLLLFALGIASTSCDADKNPDGTEISGADQFKLSAQQIEDLEPKALSGDDAALNELISYYMLGMPPDQGDRKLMYWLRVGAERKNPTYTYNFLYSATRRNASCEEIIVMFHNLDKKNSDSILEYNEFVCECVNEFR
jgi:hypothetical protein